MAPKEQHPPDEAKDWYDDLVPGVYFEVDYSDDDVSHERLALWPEGLGRWLVRSPDGDEWIEDLSGDDAETGPCVSRARRGDGRREQGRKALYAFRAKLSDADLRSRILRAFKLIKEQKGSVRLPTEVMGPDGLKVNIEEYFKGARSKIAAELVENIAA